MDTAETTVPQKSAAGQGNLFWSLVGLSLLGLTVCLVHPRGDVLLLAVLGSLLALAAVFVSLFTRQPGSRLFRSLAVCILVVANGAVVVQAARLSLRHATTYAHMKGMSVAFVHYHEKYKAYPPSLAALMRGTTQGQHLLLSPFEPESVASLNRDHPVHSSYVYQPGIGNWRPDEKIILVYEGATGASLESWPDYGCRAVLFADMHKKFLSAEEFSRAMLEDAKRRIEIGWPMYSVRPVGEDPQAATQPASAPSTTGAD